MDPISKRKVTICNLFANHELSIGDIVRILDENYVRVVHTLIDQGLIYERRKNPPKVVEEERRRPIHARVQLN